MRESRPVDWVPIIKILATEFKLTRAEILNLTIENLRQIYGFGSGQSVEQNPSFIHFKLQVQREFPLWDFSFQVEEASRRLKDWQERMKAKRLQTQPMKAKKKDARISNS